MANVSRGKERVGWAVIDAMIMILFARMSVDEEDVLELPFFLKPTKIRLLPSQSHWRLLQARDISRLELLRRRGCNKAIFWPVLVSHFSLCLQSYKLFTPLEYSPFPVALAMVLAWEIYPPYSTPPFA